MKHAFLPIVIMTCLLAACSNTLKGVGQDIERAGEAIQKVVK